MLTLMLLRHGSAGSPGRYIGQLDPPLDRTGRAQVERLTQRMRGWNVCRCLASPLQRARQTAEALANAAGVPVTLWDDFMEISFGEWEGLTFQEIAARDPAAVDRWSELADDFCFPGGESVTAFRLRVARATARLAAMSEDRLAVCAHGGVIRAMICAALELPIRNHLLFRVDHASLSVLNLVDGTGQLARLNDTAHLEEDATWPA